MAFAVLPVTKDARAEERVLTLRYIAPAECPTQATFESLVLARTTRVRFADSSPRTAVVSVVLAKGRFVGALEIDARDGVSRARRTVEAKSCGQLTEAMALVAALAIDPEASLTPDAPPPRDALEVDPAPPPSPLPLPPVRLATPLPKDAARLTAPAPARSRWTFGTGLTLVTNASPNPMVGIALRGEYERLSPSLVSPSFGAEIAAAASDILTTSDGVEITRASIHIDGCPCRILVSTLDLRACGGATLGIVHAKGIGIATSETALRPGLDIDLTVRARWEQAPWFVGIDIGPAFPITRPTFVFLQPRAVVYETPSVGLAMALTMGRHF